MTWSRRDRLWEDRALPCTTPSVDTGWVTDEDPFEQVVEKEEAQRFAPPLDSLDGAARVMDPNCSGHPGLIHEVDY